MNDEQYFLANAYLDGELTADERRIAEADPEVMAEVEQLRALQHELRDVPGPSADARETAIEAAMAAFGAAGDTAADTGADDAPASPPAAAPVVPFRTRPAYAKLLGIAAAVVAVAGLGIIVSQAGRGSDDSTDSADLAEPAAAERDDVLTESFDTDDEMAAEMAPVDGGDSAGSDAADDMPTDDMAADAGEEYHATAEATDDMALTGDDSEDAPTSDEPVVRAVPFDFDPSAPITDAADLGVYGAYLVDLRNTGQLPPTPNHACGDTQQILDAATLDLDGELVPVYIDVRDADGTVAALRTDTCAELLIGSLFAE
jgi:hypothetical protein